MKVQSELPSRFLIVALLMTAGCSNERSASVSNAGGSSVNQVEPYIPIEQTDKDFEASEEFLKNVEGLNGKRAEDCRLNLVELILEQAMITGTKNIADILDQALKITIESNVNGICSIERNLK